MQEPTEKPLNAFARVALPPGSPQCKEIKSWRQPGNEAAWE